MFGNLGVQELASMCVEARQCAFFVGAHEPAVADDIAGKNRSQPALDPSVRHSRLLLGPPASSYQRAVA
jgi:hypothetical protein